MKIGRVERKPEIPLKEQLAELRKQYAGFMYMYCARIGRLSEIVFMYEREVEKHD